jgi:hypothetical protein
MKEFLYALKLQGLGIALLMLIRAISQNAELHNGRLDFAISSYVRAAS